MQYIKILPKKFISFYIGIYGTFYTILPISTRKMFIVFSLSLQIRSDTSLCVDKTLPEIQVKCESMQQIFDRIDKLEV